MNWQLGLALTTCLIVGIALAVTVFNNRRLRTKLDVMHRDIAAGMHTLHERSDREIHERSWVIQGIRSSLEMLRIQIISLFRHEKSNDHKND